MKKLFTLALVSLGFLVHAQELSLENPVLKSGEVTYTLTDVDDWGNSTILYERCEGDLVLETGEFLNKKRSGTWRQFSKEGALLTEIKFSNGEKVWQKHYNTGNPIEVVYEEGKAVRVTYELASN